MGVGIDRDLPPGVSRFGASPGVDRACHEALCLGVRRGSAVQVRDPCDLNGVIDELKRHEPKRGPKPFAVIEWRETIHQVRTRRRTQSRNFAVRLRRFLKSFH